MSTTIKSLTPDLRTGMVPISSASASLAKLIKQASATKRPVAITQMGRPVAVIVDIDTFICLKNVIQAAATLASTE